MTRDEYGRIVRETWIAYCIENGDTKPSHLTPWNELSEYDKEADRRIGEAVAEAYWNDLNPFPSDWKDDYTSTED